MRRITQEIASLQAGLPLHFHSSIFVRADEVGQFPCCTLAAGSLWVRRQERIVAILQIAEPTGCYQSHGHWPRWHAVRERLLSL
jgi:hypothetical protein